jgi:anti-sigma B factor antagonist
MNVSAESYGHAVLLNLKGDLVEDALAAFQQTVDHQLAGKDVVDLVLNLQEVPFLDSISLEWLLDLQDHLAQRMGQVRLAKCSPDVRKILEITRLDSIFEIFEDIPEAIKAAEGA